MREALFLNAARVELDKPASQLFKQLIIRIEAGILADSPAFQEWLPVYDVVWSILCVKRELLSAEYALKSEIASGNNNGNLTPKLINCYYKLHDHCQLTGTDRLSAEETLMNITLCTPVFYSK